MKHYFLFIFVLLLVSCNNTEKSIEKDVKAYIYENAHDPDSYEAVETVVVDTVYTHSLANDKIQRFEREKKHLEQYVDEKKGVTSLSSYDQQNLLVNKAQIENYQSNINKLNSLENVIEFYVFKHKFRMKNRSGGVETDELNILTDSNCKVLYIESGGVYGEARRLFNEKYKIEPFDFNKYRNDKN